LRWARRKVFRAHLVHQLLAGKLRFEELVHIFGRIVRTEGIAEGAATKVGDQFRVCRAGNADLNGIFHHFCKLRNVVRFLMAIQQPEQRGKDDKQKWQRDHEPADDRDGQRLVQLGSGADPQRQGQ